MSADRVTEIKARLEAATPGPWEYSGEALIHAPIDDSMSDSYFLFNADPAHCDGYGNPTEDCLADAELIANAPSDLACLLAELESARARLAAVEAKASEWEQGAQAFGSPYDWDQGWAHATVNAALELRAALATGEGEDNAE